MSDLISILIPLYNHEDYIFDLMDSISKIEMKEFKVIILDDGSTDNSYSIAMDCVDQYSFSLQVFHQENQGIVDTLNKLVKLSTSEFVTFMASDDFFLPERFNFDLPLMKKKSNIVVCYSNGVKFENDKLTQEKVYLKEMNDCLQSENSFEMYNYVTTRVPGLYLQGCTIRRDFFDKINGFENMLADDWAFNIKVFRTLLETDYEYKYNSSPVFAYRIHENNIHKNIKRQYTLIDEVVEKLIPDDNKKYFDDVYSSYLAHLIMNREWGFVKSIVASKGLRQLYKMIFYYIKKFFR